MVSGILEVQLLDAKGLKKTDVFGLVAAAGRMDPYVILQYRSDDRKSSVARGESSSHGFHLAPPPPQNPSLPPSWLCLLRLGSSSVWFDGGLQSLGCSGHSESLSLDWIFEKWFFSLSM
ncbi:hypothetical protein Taro_018465 [Colocasia esculenta]|uniref:C2 domain-containing protein n=1 Tax=Colocasia esculenta TaxID=4460 RepID=A0A843UQU9_COLES|nr:hypothetical protein [Colocasia esculenta]